MSALLDTSVLVRYLSGDPPQMLPVAIEIVEGQRDLWVSSVALAETAHVLMSFYRIGRSMAIESLAALVQRANIKPLNMDKALLIQALLKALPSGRVSVPDALIWAEARSAAIPVVYSMDRRFPREGVEVKASP